MKANEVEDFVTTLIKFMSGAILVELVTGKELKLTSKSEYSQLKLEPPKETVLLLENDLSSINIKLLSENATAPTRAHEHDAGLDIYSAEDITLYPQDKRKIATDFAIDIPQGYVGFLTGRSGVSSKTDLVVSTGIIDSGYQGHVQVNMKNDQQLPDAKTYFANQHIEHKLGYPELLFGVDGERIENGNKFGTGGGRNYHIKKGDRIAQLLILPIVTPAVNIVEEFESETARGDRGFGSTGY